MAKLQNLRCGRLAAALAAAGLLAACADGNEAPDGGGPGDGDARSDGDVDVPPADDGGETPTCATASDRAVPRPVDIIIGIDQSASMGEEIAGVLDNLNTNLTPPLAAAGLDYRVIFVAGVTGLPSGPEFFHCDAAVNSSDLLTLLLWTYDGAYRAPNTCNRVEDAVDPWGAWLRQESYKVFIAVTDDDPTSFDCANAAAACTDTCDGCAADCAGWCPMYQCPTYADAPAEWGGGTFLEELYRLLPPDTFGTPEAPRWIFHSIVPVPRTLTAEQPLTRLDEVCEFSGNTGETSGVEYQKLSRLTGGLRFPSCDTDYSPVFETIATTIIPMACTFALETTSLGTPDPDRTNVELDLGDGLGSHTVPLDPDTPCDSAHGWQWLVEGETLRLCGDVCAEVQSTPDAVVTITVGCATLII